MTLTRDADEMQSERLILRRIEPGDLGFLTRLHADAEVARYLGHGRPRSPEESLSWLQSTLTNYDMFGLGQLAVLRKSDGRLIGRCGLSDLIVEIRPAGARSVEPGTPGAWFQRAQAPAGIEVQFERELGYTFERAVWGHGYATEAAGRVFDYACNVLRLPRVVSLIHADNTRSLRVAQRFGAQREDTVDVLGRSFDRYVWPSARLP